MINYAYPTLFLTEGTQKDLLITDGTVTVSGTTYTVSGETVLIDNSILDQEAFELYQSLNSEMQLTFGLCDTASIKFTVHKSDNSNITGTVLTVYLIPNHDASKMLQIGVFKVAEDVRSQDRKKHTITAYDAMYDILNADVSIWYNTILPDDNTSVTVAQFRASFMSNFGITEEAVTLVNDDKYIRQTLKIVKDDTSLDAVSGADIIRSICQINGVFGTITNLGEFRYVSLVDPISSSLLTTDMPVSYCLEVNEGEIFYPFKKVIVKTPKGTAAKAWAWVGNKNIFTVTNNILVSDYSAVELGNLTDDLFTAVDGHEYTPFTLTAIGNPLHEVGDPIKVFRPDGTYFYSYILERRMTGVQALRDTYTANGTQVWDESLNTIASRLNDLSGNEGGGGGGGGGGGQAIDFVETIRNIGFRLLDEPDNVSVIYDNINNQIELKWQDPSDISTNEPVPASWNGTVVVRKEGSAPFHRWDGTVLEDSTTRNAHSSVALVDGNIQEDKTYFYGIFPYDTRGYYRFTKVERIAIGERQKVYGIRIAKNTSNPSSRCEYILDAFGFTPASGNNGSFSYGSWGDIWFVADNYPCMVKFDGTVDYRLKKDDYSKREDESSSDISNINYAGNAMSAMPLTWLYQYEDSDYQYILVSQSQINQNFKAYAHTDENGIVHDYVYMSIYRGTIDGNNRLRSISGQSPYTTGKTAADEISMAKANGSGWFTKTWSQRNLLKSLITLIFKSTDSQSALGRGHLDHSGANNGVLDTGTLNSQGQFYGRTSNYYQVKAFHQESVWGDQSDRLAGLILDNGVYKVKMTPPYAETNLSQSSSYSSYHDMGLSIGGNVGNFISASNMSEYGDIPVSTQGGSSSSYECDTLWWSNSNIQYPAVGGDNAAGDGAGINQMGVINAPDRLTWDMGASLSYL